MTLFFITSGQPNDGGILPRSLDVIFNSIEDRQWSDMSLKPKMFGNVVQLTPSQLDKEQLVKERVFKMANPDVSVSPLFICLISYCQSGKSVSILEFLKHTRTRSHSTHIL